MRELCIWVGQKVESDDSMIIEKQIDDQNVCNLVDLFIDFIEDHNIIIGEFAKYDAVPELVKMLQEVEFIQVETDYGTHEYCPICEQQFHDGHSKDCRLNKMIKEWGGNHVD